MGALWIPKYELLMEAPNILRRRLMAWSDNDPVVDWIYVAICLLLTIFAGLMSGLTLGLLSLDTVELEVLLRSGTPKEQKYARKIMPIVANGHLLLVTLLFGNALAMEALPLYLDKLADPVTAVIISVTAVLLFGEIIPQSVCTRYGLAIGAYLAPLVRLLMLLSSPVAWPMGKLLDLVLGPDHHTLFRRRQLKELVSIHAEDAGMGGKLTRDEIKVITGALDLTNKVAFRAMTPLDKVFMLSSSDQLDEATLRSILRSGHSRIPVHRQGDRSDVVGLVLVKELLQYRLATSEPVPVAMLRMRSIPRLPATTPMYDMLRLFQTGRSHIAVLTQPPASEAHRMRVGEPSGSRSRAGQYHGKAGAAAAGGGISGTSCAGGGGGVDAAGRGAAGGGDMPGGVTPAADDARSMAAETEIGGEDSEVGYGPMSPSYFRPNTAADVSFSPDVRPTPAESNGTLPLSQPSAEETTGFATASSGGVTLYDPYDSGHGNSTIEAPPPSFRRWAPIEVTRSGSAPPPAEGDNTATGPCHERPPPVVRQSSAFASAGVQEALAAAAGGVLPPPPALSPVVTSSGPTGAPPSPSGSSSALTAALSSGVTPHRLSRVSHEHGFATAAAAASIASAGGAAAAAAVGSPASSRLGGSGGAAAGSLAATLSGSPTAAVAGLGVGLCVGAGGADGGGGAAACLPSRASDPSGREGALTEVSPAEADAPSEARLEALFDGQPSYPRTSAGEVEVAAPEAGPAPPPRPEDGGWQVEEGRPIGIITIEDVIEELIRSEIVDETDRYVDNDRRIKVNPERLAARLPEHLAKVLAITSAGRKAVLQRVRSHSGGGPLGMALGLGAGGSTQGSGSHRGAGRAGAGAGGLSYQSQYNQSTEALRLPLLGYEG